MLDFAFADYGTHLPGKRDLVATGSTQADALPITSRINHFVTVPPNAGAKLPQVGAFDTLELTVINRGANDLKIYPVEGAFIEGLAANTPVTVPAGQNGTFHCFDSPVNPGKRWSATLYQTIQGLAEAPLDGNTWGRYLGTWAQVLPISGGTMTGPLTLAGDPTGPLQPLTLQYFNAHSGAVTVSDTPPSTRAPGNLWFDSANTRLMVYYQDPDSSQWVVANNTAGGIADAPSDGNAYMRASGGWASGGTLTSRLTVNTSANPAVIISNGTGANDLLEIGSATANSGQLNLRSSNRATGIVYWNGPNIYWNLQPLNEATGSGNGGMDFVIRATADNGALLPASLTITRSTGLATVVGDPTAALGIATKQYVDTHGGGISSLVAGTGLTGGTITPPGGTIALSVPVSMVNGGTGSSSGGVGLDNLFGFTGPSNGLVRRTTTATYAVDGANYLTANQTVTLSGDISGSGATAITTTLPNVNANTGTFQGITVNAKGQVTAATNQSYAPLASPTFTGTVTIPSGASIAGYAPLASPTFTGTVTTSALLVNGGESFGNVFAASTTDLSKHLNLNTLGYGINVTSQKMSCTVPASAAFGFNVAGTDYLTISASLVNVTGSANFAVGAGGANAINIQPATTGNPAVITTSGTDSSRSIQLVPVGGGTVQAPTVATADNSTAIATTAWVKNQGYGTSGATVSSVGLTMPSGFSVSGSPVTTSGTLAVTESTQSANRIKAGPSSGSAATPTYRALVQADLPSFVDAPNGSGRTYVSGRFYGPQITNVTNGSTITANNAYALPFVAQANGTIVSLSMSISTAASTAMNWTFAVYSDNSGAPGTLLVSANTGSATTPGTGVQTLSLSLAITQGTLYWLVSLFDATSSAKCYGPNGGAGSQNGGPFVQSLLGAASANALIGVAATQWGYVQAVGSYTLPANNSAWTASSTLATTPPYLAVGF